MPTVGADTLCSRQWVRMPELCGQWRPEPGSDPALPSPQACDLERACLPPDGTNYRCKDTAKIMSVFRVLLTTDKSGGNECGSGCEGVGFVCVSVFSLPSLTRVKHRRRGGHSESRAQPQTMLRTSHLRQNSGQEVLVEKEAKMRKQTRKRKEVNANGATTSVPEGGGSWVDSVYIKRVKLAAHNEYF